jgi:hypothetical protein
MPDNVGKALHIPSCHFLHFCMIKNIDSLEKTFSNAGNRMILVQLLNISIKSPHTQPYTPETSFPPPPATAHKPYTSEVPQSYAAPQAPSAEAEQ